MIDIEYIRSFFPATIARDNRFDRYMLKEYLQLLILDHLASTPYINKVSFIGGNLRAFIGMTKCHSVPQIGEGSALPDGGGQRDAVCWLREKK